MGVDNNHTEMLSAVTAYTNLNLYFVIKFYALMIIIASFLRVEIDLCIHRYKAYQHCCVEKVKTADQKHNTQSAYQYF